MPWWLVLVGLLAFLLTVHTSLADLDLESLLLQDGDLPSGITGGQITNRAGPIFDALPHAEQIKGQVLEYDGVGTGSVKVWLFIDAATAKIAFDIAAKGMSKRGQPVDGLGDASLGAYRDGEEGIPLSAHLFQRCNALVYIIGRNDKVTSESVRHDTWITYAKRLDNRLRLIVC